MKKTDFPETKYVDFEPGALGRIAEMFRTCFPGAAALVVADPATWNAAGRAVYGNLREAGVPVVRPFVFGDAPFENDAAAREVENALAGADASRPAGAETVIAVAVGSGTLNDLCKLASHRAGGRPYHCCATAASVDGFASFGAAMTDDDGFKKTQPCPAPLCITADPDVLAAAPKHLLSSGYGDLFGKFTAGADWIVAEEVTGRDPIDPRAWEMVQGPLAGWTLHPKELMDGDAGELTGIFEGLTASGLAMQLTRLSRPASGAEHLFSHVWEMSHLRRADGSAPSHGHQVALGSICTLAVYIRLFKRPFTADDIQDALDLYPSWEQRESLIRSLFPAGKMCDSVVRESRAKHLGRDELRERLANVSCIWEDLRERVDRQLMHFPRMRAMLLCAKCPITPADIGLTPQRAAATAIAAQMIRRRYTVLDLAYETGRLAECAQAVADAFAAD